MAEFEDNNPFAGSDNVLSIENNDIGNLNIDNENDYNNLYKNEDSSKNIDKNIDNNNIKNLDNKRHFSSRIEQVLVNDPNVIISIVDAGKSHEGSSGGYIAYTIRTNDILVRRRYSEFESLRNSLISLFPTFIIPPIPEKHSMSDYAASPTKAKEDIATIEHRRRMLSVFLNRCKKIEQIRNSSVFQRFLDPNASWSEVLTSPPLSLLPKSSLKTNPLDPAHPSSAHSYLSKPSSGKLKNNDEEFQDIEDNARAYEHVISGGLEKANRRIIRKYNDLAMDFSELGARYNAFSLGERSEDVARAIERIGQAVDGNYLATEELITALGSSFSEPLGESAQYAHAVRAVLKFRRLKILQKENTFESLLAKTAYLETLEKSEQQVQKINNVLYQYSTDLDSPRDTSTPIGSSGSVIGTNGNNDKINNNLPISTSTSSLNTNSNYDKTNIISGHPDNGEIDNSHNGISNKPSKKSGFKFPGIEKINSAIHGIIDADPETTRRNNIGKTKEQILQLQEALNVLKVDVEHTQDSVQKNFEEFQKDKEDDLREMMVSFAKYHLEWARKSLKTWQETEVEVNNIRV